MITKVLPRFYETQYYNGRKTVVVVVSLLQLLHGVCKANNWYSIDFESSLTTDYFY